MKGTPMDHDADLAALDDLGDAHDEAAQPEAVVDLNASLVAALRPPGHACTARMYADAMTVRRYLRGHVPNVDDRQPWETALSVTLRDIMARFMVGAQVTDVDADTDRPSRIAFMDGTVARVDADGIWYVEGGPPA